MSASQKALNFINEAISKGSTIYISTHLQRIMVSPKTFAKWEKSGHKLFKIDAEGNLRIASGKNYNVIATPSMCLVQIATQ